MDVTQPCRVTSVTRGFAKSRPAVQGRTAVMVQSIPSQPIPPGICGKFVILSLEVVVSYADVLRELVFFFVVVVFL